MNKFNLNDYRVQPQAKISKRVIFQDGNVLAFILNFAPGAVLPNHTHFTSTLLMKVLQGSANATIEGTIVPVTEGDLLQIEGSENMSVENTGTGKLELYITLSPTPTAVNYAKDVDI